MLWIQTQQFCESSKIQELPIHIDGNLKSSFVIRTSDLTLGTHRLTLRGEDENGVWNNLFSREFTVKDFNGVNEVSWSNSFQLSQSNGNLKIAPSGFANGTVIEVYTFDGKLVNRSIWENTDDALNINIGVQTFLIVKATQPDGSYAIETIR